MFDAISSLNATISTHFPTIFCLPPLFLLSLHLKSKEQTFMTTSASASTLPCSSYPHEKTQIKIWFFARLIVSLQCEILRR